MTSATAATALPRALPPDAPAQRLPGDLVVWLLVLLELLTFGMLFVAFAERACATLHCSPRARPRWT